MLRVLTTVALLAGFAAPTLAQQNCEAEANAVWATVQASDQLDDAQKNQVAGVLNNALQQEANGDTDACLSAVEEIKVALNIQE